MAADRIGRKRAFLVDMAILAVGSALCVTAPNPWLILAGEFGLGYRYWNRLSDEWLLCFRNHAQRRTEPDDGALQSVGIIAAALVGMSVLRVHPAMTDWRI
jgi:MFS transporter, putative metabolite transport protein